MKRIFLLLFIITLAGCKGIDPQSEDSSTQKSAPAGEVLLSIKNRDFDLFCRASGEMEKPRTKEEFIKSCEQLTAEHGKISGFKFLTFLNTPPVDNQIWVVDFEHRSADGRKFFRQRLFQIITGKIDGSQRLLGMRFI